jgi:RNA polymerase sigma-70 factor (ECF subfamily)
MRKKDQEIIFHKWIDEFKPLLFKIVKVYGSETNEEQDLFQEIVIQIWRSVATFNNQCSLHTWIYRVALNTAIKWSTRSKKQYTIPLDQKDFLIETKAPVDPKLEWMYDEIAKMDSIDRSLTMLLLDGFSYKEMSEILGITSSNVGVKINRIKKKLQERAKLLQNEY